MRTLPVGVSGGGHRRHVRRARPRSRTPSGCSRRIARRRPRRAPRLGRQRHRRLAVPRGVRVHRGLSVRTSARPSGSWRCARSSGAAGRDGGDRSVDAVRRGGPVNEPGLDVHLESRGRARAVPGTRSGARASGPVAWFDFRRSGHGALRVLAEPDHRARARVLPLPAPRGALPTPGWCAMRGTRSCRLATTPLFLGLDVLLVFGLLAHGLNGLRVALVGSGFVRRTGRRRCSGR